MVSRGSTRDASFALCVAFFSLPGFLSLFPCVHILRVRRKHDTYHALVARSCRSLFKSPFDKTSSASFFRGTVSHKRSSPVPQSSPPPLLGRESPAMFHPMDPVTPRPIRCDLKKKEKERKKNADKPNFLTPLSKATYKKYNH